MQEEALALRKEVAKAYKDFPVADLIWNSSADLVAAATGNKAVQVCEHESFHTIDVEKTFGDLVQVSNLLQVALTAAGNQPCSVPILRIMSKYQDVVTSCTQTSGSFVDACLASLKIHKFIKKALEKGKPDMAFKKYGECAVLADKMADEASTLADKLEQLKINATDALIQAKDNMVDNEKAQKDVDNLLAKLKSEEAYIESQLDSLAAEVSEVKEEEAKFAKQANEERDRAHSMALTGAIIGGMTSIIPVKAMSAVAESLVSKLPSTSQSTPTPPPAQMSSQESAAVGLLKDARMNAQAEMKKLKSELNLFRESKEASTVEGKDKIKQMEAEVEKGQQAVKDASLACQKASAQNSANAESLEAKEAAATARRRDLMDAQREQKSRLKQSVKEMEGMTADKSQIAQTLQCLSVTLQTMGRVKTTFSQVEMFWRAVAQQCKQLGGMKDDLASVWALADEDEKGLDPFAVIQDNFQQSAVHWAALGFVNHKAHSRMVQAMDGINDKMCQLPGGAVDGALVDRMVKDLSMSLELDDADMS